jgi:hypothetical protein
MLLYFLIIGAGDALNVYFLLHNINIFLDKNGLKFNYRSFLLMLGINNMGTSKNWFL